jgi:hypothetical protein
MKATQLFALCVLLGVNLSLARAQGVTAFAYQGRLNEGGDPVSGLYDFTFKLVDASDGGSQAGGGSENQAIAAASTVAGGAGNEAKIVGATVGGGFQNTADGVKATVSGGNAWSATSDRNVKENFPPVDPRAVLEKMVEMPITEWNLQPRCRVATVMAWIVDGVRPWQFWFRAWPVPPVRL